MPTCRSIAFLALMLSCVAVTSPALARQRAAAEGPAPVAQPTAAELKTRAAALADRKAMQAELKLNAERAKASVVALEARNGATPDAPTRALIQRHIEAVKRDAELEFFRIQLRHAQAMGRAADVSELQGVIDAQLRQPAPALAPLPPIERKAAQALPVQTKKESGK